MVLSHSVYSFKYSVWTNISIVGQIEYCDIRSNRIFSSSNSSIFDLTEYAIVFSSKPNTVYIQNIWFTYTFYIKPINTILNLCCISISAISSLFQLLVEIKYRNKFNRKCYLASYEKNSWEINFVHVFLKYSFLYKELYLFQKYRLHFIRKLLTSLQHLHKEKE